ncbi:ankyrin repeat-containing domain protein [Rhodocollybia butyracea]|uniref:Ankyrin repeat-containing domain protein n=1 Tax=Rhodocollybia butyracea TaxID=206335 RepID=A0A9P5Q0K7_9AGAR|nr:ankyrin repeat-containing domain protein [Rhodocollybia butyracea]
MHNLHAVTDLQDERTPLHWAASSGSLEIARYLIGQKAEVDKVDGSGWSALHIAVSAGHDDVVEELVGSGADVNKCGPYWFGESMLTSLQEK